MLMDHLPQLCTSAFPDSKIAKGLACPGTKTTAVINNVIGDENFKNICENLRNKKFSIIIDESTDLSTQKHLCIVVRYMTEDSVKLCTSAFPDSKIAKGLACPGTKTTAVINNVIGDENFKNICENLRNKKFSIIIDESTDLSTQKHLCIVVRYMTEDSVKVFFLN
ncbi:hypothetical protein QE152_g12694 [Popillia japonica]|uniref:DUF4371 domain-containing protein n=1 Tax=Popillia japonica TaxID=7064 RepID=A0AAW1LQX2_POPJA